MGQTRASWHTTTWASPSRIRGSTRRRWLISPRRCGSIPVLPMPTTTWASLLARRGSTRRRGSLPRGAAAQSRLRRCPQQPGSAPVPGEVRGGGGSLPRGAAAQSRLRRCPQQPGSAPRATRGSTRRRWLITPRPAAQSRLRRCTQQPGPCSSRIGKPRRRRLNSPGPYGSIRTLSRSTTTLGLRPGPAGEVRRGEAHYHEALRVNPSSAEAHNNLRISSRPHRARPGRRWLDPTRRSQGSRMSRRRRLSLPARALPGQKRHSEAAAGHPLAAERP